MPLSAAEQAAAAGLQQALAFMRSESFQVGAKSFNGNWNDGGAGFVLEGPGGKKVTLKGSIIAKRSEFPDWLPLAWTLLKRGAARLLITEVIVNEVFIFLNVGSETA